MDGYGVRQKNRWVNGGSSYAKEDGTLAENEWLEIDGKKYYFDFNGVMVTGKFNVWNGNTNDFYYANSSGEIVCNQWVKRGFDWFLLAKMGNF